MITTDDNTAISILKTIAGARLQPNSSELTLNPDFRAALTAAFGHAPQNATTEGELARAALNVLAEDPAFSEPIQLMTRQAAASTGQRYFEPATVALTTAVLLVLQTRVHFNRDKDGKWFLDIDKPSASDSTVKLLVQRLLSFLGK